MRLFLFVPLMLLTACASTPSQSPRFTKAADLTYAATDPWENTNRSIYRFNSEFDRILGRPVVKVYRAVIPGAARRGISGFYSNAGEPTNAANSIAQGKIKSAFRALDRLLINTVLGVGGLADHATDMGLPEEKHDFGQTLTVWGVGSGPYLVIPFLGPSTVRDGFGFGVDFFADPSDLAANALLSRQERWFKLGIRIVNIRNRLEDSGGGSLLRGSADEYATVRSAWLQLRTRELYDGSPPQIDDEELSEPAPSPSPSPVPDNGPAPATPATSDPAPPPPPAAAAADKTTPAPQNH
nr:VacJ family lipoprotein [Sandaracinobacteroides saxicola]